MSLESDLQNARSDEEAAGFARPSQAKRAWSAPRVILPTSLGKSEKLHTTREHVVSKYTFGPGS